MNNSFYVDMGIALVVLAFLAGFSFAVGMSAFELVCSLLWSFF